MGLPRIASQIVVPIAPMTAAFAVPSSSWTVGGAGMSSCRMLAASRRSIQLNCTRTLCISGNRLYATNESNSSSASSSGEIRFERPQMFQLEHVQKRLESTIPLMFRHRLDYTFYRKDVILQDRIFNMERVGITAIQQHFGVIAVTGKLLFPHIETELLNVSPFLEDGTVRLRWRVVYLSWLKALDLRNFKLKNRLKKVSWYDGYSIFYVDGEGLVYKFTLQRIMPDDESKTKKLAQKMGVLPNAAANCVKHALSTSYVASIRPETNRSTTNRMT